MDRLTQALEEYEAALLASEEAEECGDLEERLEALENLERARLELQRARIDYPLG